MFTVQKAHCVPLGTFIESREDWFIKGTEAKKDVMIMRDIIKGEAREGKKLSKYKDVTMMLPFSSPVFIQTEVVPGLWSNY